MTARELEQHAALSAPDGVTVPVKAQREAVKFVNWLVSHGVSREAAADGVQKFLLAIVGKKTPAKATTSTPAIRSLVGLYTALYRDVYGEELKSPPGMEIAHLAKLARDYSVPVVEGRMRALATYVKTDPFMARLGFKPSTLVNQWIRVTAYAKQHQMSHGRPDAPADCRHTPRCQDAHEHTTKMLADQRTHHR